jgi:hypothetical protein
MRPEGNTEERHYRWVTGMDYHGVPSKKISRLPFYLYLVEFID